MSASPPPWRLKGTVYVLFFWTTRADAERLSPAHADSLAGLAYSPLEAGSSYAAGSLNRGGGGAAAADEGASAARTPAAAAAADADDVDAGRAVGGMSMVQLLRYRESPVGPYDEIVMLPGFFEYEEPVAKVKGSATPPAATASPVGGADATASGPGSSKAKTRKVKRLRVTRIYVSTPEACSNGRRNWSIPKHLARFEWTDHADGRASVQIFPLDGSSASASTPALPFFAATFHPSRVLGAVPFPFSTRLDRYLGLNWTLVHPPLPDGTAGGNGGDDDRNREDPAVLPGTSRWCACPAVIATRAARLGWLDMRQPPMPPPVEGGGGSSGGGGGGGGGAGAGAGADAVAVGGRGGEGGGGEGNGVGGAGDALLDSPGGRQQQQQGQRGATPLPAPPNFWPGLGRWRLAVRMEDADVVFPVGECWE